MTLRSNITLKKRFLSSGEPLYVRPLMVQGRAEIGCLHEARAFRYRRDGEASGGRVWAGILPNPSIVRGETKYLEVVDSDGVTRHLDVIDSKKLSLCSFPCLSVAKGGHVLDGIVDSETYVSVFFFSPRVFHLVLDTIAEYRKKHKYLLEFLKAIDGFTPPLTFQGEGFGNGGTDFGMECLSYFAEEMESREERNIQLGVSAGGYSAFEYFLDAFFGGRKKTSAKDSFLEKIRIVIENPIPILRLEKSGRGVSTMYDVKAVLEAEDYVGSWAEDLTDMYKAIPFVGEGIPREAFEECFIESYPREL